MDNRVFNVNGSGKQQLLKTLELCFEQEGTNTKAKAYKINKKHGMILYWHKDKNTIGLPAAMTPNALLEMIWEWLKSEEADTIELPDWDEDLDHDGHNRKGWRVYCEGWGYVDDSSYAICAVKPAYMWIGK